MSDHPYNMIDFRACVKHAYYGAKDEEAIHCEKTDRRFANWQVACADFLTRYIIPILDAGGSQREILVTHDMGRDYRTGLYADYKGQKSKKDENKSPVEIAQYEAAMDWAKRFFTALGATQIGVKGVEADDVMAWIHQRVPGPKNIYTVDGDMLQLVDDDTIVHLKGVPHFGSDGVYPEGHDLEGLPYNLTSFAKSIIGDSADNYGGVKGMGPAKIRALIESVGIDGLEQLQEIVRTGNTDLLKESAGYTGDKVLLKLLENYTDWKQGWRLANLNPDLCWKPRGRKLVKPIIHKRVPNPQRLHDLLREVGCDDMWEKNFQALMPAPMAMTPAEWAEMKEAVFAELLLGDTAAFDYESSDKEPIARFRMASASGSRYVDMLSQELAGASFQFGRHLENVIYIPVDHADTENNLPKEVIKEILEFCQANGIQLVAHNALFEGVLSQTNLGLRLKNVHDTRIMKRFYDENTEAGLKFLSLHYLGYEQTSYEDTLMAGNGGQGVSMMCQLTLDEVFTYGTDDSLVTGHLHDLLKLLLMLDGQWDFYSQWAVRPTEVLQRAYIDGVDMNWALQRRLHARDLKTIEEGMVDLRQILLKNVTGNITPGCKSLIEAERDYIFRSAKKKAEGDTDVATAKLVEWRKKLEAACQYTPYRTEQIMPTFAFTPVQLTMACEKVGLGGFEKLTNKSFAEWLQANGFEGFEDSWEATPDQKELAKALAKAMAAGCLKLSDLRKKVNDEPDNEAAASKLDAAEREMEKVGEVVQRLAKIEPRVVEFGDPLNVGSPQQMQQLLYCKIGMPVRLRGKNVGKGRLAVGIGEAGPSTDEQAILTAFANDIKDDCWQKEALQVLLKVKSATTRCSLYHDKYPLWRHRDGKIHPSITDAGTDTLRPTGSAPNVLQVSKKDIEMRSMFIPPNRDYVCVAIDFNGQEIRLMANLAKDEVMLSVYEPGNEKDLHSMTASGIAKMTYEQFVIAYNDENHPQHKLVNKLRKKAKTINFGMAYGAGPGTLSRNLIAPIEEAKALLEQTFNLYNRIQPWQEETATFMEKYGYTETSFGTKRHANNDIFSNDKGKVGRQHRQGTNATIQSTAAQMLRIVLTNVAASDMLDRIRMVFFAPIYDEIVAWVHKDDVYDYCHEMGGYMEKSTPPGHVVRQVPEYSIGPDWGRVHELKRDISPEKVKEFVDRALDEATNIWEVDLLEPFDPILKRTVVEFDEDQDEVEVDVVD
ncbi:putative DNA polymerase I [Pseudomonas phage UAntarctica]|nr:putative DNA polymerase I [Pseudomonas phage UAntarctica]